MSHKFSTEPGGTYKDINSEMFEYEGSALTGNVIYSYRVTDFRKKKHKTGHRYGNWNKLLEQYKTTEL
jgi:hypothetical protein